MACTADTSVAAQGLAIAVDAAAAAAMEVTLGMMHVLASLVQCSLDKRL
jgi:hypothetical protein